MLESLTATLLGQTVAGCSVSEHVFEGHEPSLLDVRFEFADHSAVTIKTANSGFIESTAEPLEPFDMAEYGKSEVRPETFGGTLQRGVRIEAISPLTDDGELVGIRLDTDRSASVWIFNWGDDLVATPHLPDYVSP